MPATVNMASQYLEKRRHICMIKLPVPLSLRSSSMNLVRNSFLARRNVTVLLSNFDIGMDMKGNRVDLPPRTMPKLRMSQHLEHILLSICKLHILPEDANATFAEFETESNQWKRSRRCRLPRSVVNLSGKYVRHPHISRPTTRTISTTSRRPHQFSWDVGQDTAAIEKQPMGNTEITMPQQGIHDAWSRPAGRLLS